MNPMLINTESLWPQFKELQEFAFTSLTNAALAVSASDEVLTELPSTVNILKLFVQNDKHDNLCSELVKLLSFCVAFPVSEAIVESWGSTISHLYSIKHNPNEPSNDLQETGTIDKLTFVRLCGPPPGMKSNRRLLKRALNEHYKSDFGGHFVNHCPQFQRATSKVVQRIISPSTSNILPCFI